MSIMALTEQSHAWLCIAKAHLKERVAYRLRERLQHIECVINKSLPPNVCRLTIEDSIRYQIFEEAKVVIDQYEGPKKLQRNLETSQKTVIEKARTWWNRTKSHKLGRSFFGVICFYLLHNFISSHCSFLSEKEQLLLFIEIFQNFLTTSIKFHRTKAKPLILQQCFLHGDTFKEMCMGFVHLFGDENIRWAEAVTMGLHVENGRRVYKYVKDKNRSEQLAAKFLKCTQEIKKKIIAIDENNEWLKEGIGIWKTEVQRLKPQTYDVLFCKPSNAAHASAGIAREKTIECKQNDTVNYHCPLMDTTNATQQVQQNVDNLYMVHQTQGAVNCIQDIVSNKPDHQSSRMFAKHNSENNIIHDGNENNPFREANIGTMKCEPIQIPEECQCKCLECEASFVHLRNEFDYRQFQPMNNFGCIQNREHRTYNKVMQDVNETSQRTLRLLKHLRSLWCHNVVLNN